MNKLSHNHYYVLELVSVYILYRNFGTFIQILQMNYNELTQNLLPQNNDNNQQISAPKNKGYISLIYRNSNYDNHYHKSFDFAQEEQLRLISSQIQRPQLKTSWNEQQINQRSFIFAEAEQLIHRDGEHEIQISNEQNSNNVSIERDLIIGLRGQSAIRLKSTTSIVSSSSTKKQLNYRIFYLNRSLLNFLYYFNLLFNLIFRLSLIFILVILIIEEGQYLVMGIIIGLQGVALFLYLIAMHKMLYTKSSDISVYFQKSFYQKPYAQIHMDRIMRKHFTFNNMFKNFTKFLNPFTEFRKDIKISIIRQQIFKRMEIIFVFIPLVLTFVINIHWFDFRQVNSEAMIGVVFCFETVRIFLHYLIIYIYS